MFEALVERDLRIYADYLGGQLYHFRDNISGDEVDAIIEFKDGNYAAFGHVIEGMDIVDKIESDIAPLAIDDNGTIEYENQPVITSIKVVD